MGIKDGVDGMDFDGRVVGVELVGEWLKWRWSSGSRDRFCSRERMVGGDVRVVAVRMCSAGTACRRIVVVDCSAFRLVELRSEPE